MIPAWYFIFDSVIFTEIRRCSDKSFGKKSIKLRECSHIQDVVVTKRQFNYFQQAIRIAFLKDIQGFPVHCHIQAETNIWNLKPGAD